MRLVCYDHGVLGPSLLGTHVLEANYWSDAQKEIYGLFSAPSLNQMFRNLTSLTTFIINLCTYAEI